MKLLLAEDDRDLCLAVRTMLERAGYSADVVCNGEDAIDYVLHQLWKAFHNRCYAKSSIMQSWHKKARLCRQSSAINFA